MPCSLQVTCQSPDVWGSVITTFLIWDCKDDESAESSEGNPVLPMPCKGNGLRGALSTDPKKNTHSYLTRTAKRSINSPTNESNFFQKDIQPHLKKTQTWQFPSRTSQQTAPVFYHPHSSDMVCYLKVEFVKLQIPATGFHYAFVSQPEKLPLVFFS